MMTHVKSKNASTWTQPRVVQELSNYYKNVVNNFLSDKLTSLSAASGFNYSTVKRYDYVGHTQSCFLGLGTSPTRLINFLSGWSQCNFFQLQKNLWIYAFLGLGNGSKYCCNCHHKTSWWWQNHCWKELITIASWLPQSFNDITGIAFDVE